MDWDEVVSGKRSQRSSARSSAAPTRRRSSGGGGRAGRPSSKKKTKKTSIGKKIGLGVVFTVLAVAIVGAGAFLYLYMTLSVPKADEVALAQNTTVYYSDGTTEMGSFSQVNRTIIDASTLPDYVGEAVVASEDRTFYTNSGVDLKGILRALVNNVTGGARQGASTLTQQYVENYYLGSTHTYAGKVKESVLAVKINQEQSKDEILGNYLNTIYFGRGAYGIQAASQAYFGIDADKLDVSQAAMIAGIIPAPSAWDPAIDKAKAQQRWERVLTYMVEDGWISQSEADSAKFPDTVDPNTLTTSTLTGTTGYLLQQVREEVQGTGAFTDEQIDSGGLKIITTIDKKKQDAAVAAAESMTQVEGWDSSSMHTALSSMDPSTGEIVAEYAGADYQKRQQNAVTGDIAAAGSTFKPFALLTYAQQGGSMEDTFNGSSPEYYDGLTDPVTNDGGYSWGTVDLIKATKYSINTAFVKLNEQVGPANTEKTLVDAGFPEKTNGLEPTLLNVLGFAAPHNIDITTAYSTLASGGLKVEAHIVREVQDSSGATVYKTTVNPQRVFEAGDVSTIIPAMEAVMSSGGTGEKAAELGRTVAGKTGTSEDQKSAQFVAFVPQLVTTVSMYQSGSNNEQVPLTNIGGLDQFHGGDWPADVWLQYMQVATQGMDNTGFSWLTASTRTPSQTPTQAPSQEPTTQEPTETATTEAPSQTPSTTPSTQQSSGGSGGNGGDSGTGDDTGNGGGDSGTGGDTGNQGDTGGGGDTGTGGDSGTGGDTGNQGDTGTGGNTGTQGNTGTGGRNNGAAGGSGGTGNG